MIEYLDLHVQGEERLPGFAVETVTKKGETKRLGCRTLILALGPSSTPSIPPAFLSFADGGRLEGEGWCHSTAFGRAGFVFPSLRLSSQTEQGRSTTMVVVGGGYVSSPRSDWADSSRLTAAQIAHVAIERGVSKVILLCRGHLTVRLFDFPLAWVSKYAGILKSSFFQEEDPHERLRFIKEARGGGSITPTYQRLLKGHVKRSKLEILTHTVVSSAQFDAREQRWSLELVSRSGPGGEDVIRILDDVDFVALSTGSQLSFDKVRPP